jgi:FMN phosphatase YigB (HAD superfamily)
VGQPGGGLAGRARAGRSWFVGDDPVWDVEGARGAGLTPVLIAPSGNERESRERPPDSAEVAPLRVRTLGALVALLSRASAGTGSAGP